MQAGGELSDADRQIVAGLRGRLEKQGSRKKGKSGAEHKHSCKLLPRSMARIAPAGNGRRLLSDRVKRNLRPERQRQFAREVVREQADTLQELAMR